MFQIIIGSAQEADATQSKVSSAFKGEKQVLYLLLNLPQTNFMYIISYFIRYSYECMLNACLRLLCVVFDFLFFIEIL